MNGTTYGGPVQPRRRTRRGAGLAAAIFVLVLAGTLGGIQAMPTRYAATAVVSFTPRPESQVSADTVALIGQKYVVLATSPATMTSAGAGVGIGAADLTRATSAVLQTGTGNVDITVTLADPRPAVRAVNAVAAVLVRASQPDPLVDGEQTAPAVDSSVRIKPARMLLRVAGLLAALLTAAVVVALRDRARPAAGPAGRRPDAADAHRPPGVAAGWWADQ